MLLNDEEIGTIINDLGNRKAGAELGEMGGAVAKAQLKKVVKWILANGYEDCDGGGDSTWVISFDTLNELLSSVKVSNPYLLDEVNG